MPLEAARLEFIHTCPFFEKLSKEELELVDASKSIWTFEKDDVVFKRDTFVEKLFFVKEGFVKLMLQSNYHKNFILEFVGKGELVNVIFTGLHKTPITAVAHGRTEIYAIELNFAKEIMLKNPHFAFDLINYSTSAGDRKSTRLNSSH